MQARDEMKQNETSYAYQRRCFPAMFYFKPFKYRWREGWGGVVLFVLFGQGCSTETLRPLTPYQTMFRLHTKQPYRYPRLAVPDQVSVPIRD